ncbi:MAG: membrane-bound lytic murein transglycosylase D [Desulforhopalus sp.]|jgi:membrane-bound lytic murein transglycosylase D
MIFKSVTFRSIILSLTLSSFLSGCASINHLDIFQDDDQTILADSTLTETSETESDLVELEPLMCLNEELHDLNLTGMWSSQPESTSALPKETIKYNFPVVVNKQVDMYLQLFQGKQRKQFARWLARSGKYRVLMEEELRNAGLPTDLMYLSMIESGYYELAYSRSKAVGLWQFMKGTGKQYHLKIDKYVDERRDPVKSTKAAVAYLSDLYKEFGNWHLAVAAYNGGPGKVRSGLRRHKVDTFWDLASKKHLRLETKRYVPKLIAALVIAKDPKKYGFTNIQYEQGLQYDTITVGPNMSLNAIALISDSTEKEIKALNHELKRNRTPANSASYVAKIPITTSAIAQKNISRLHSIASTGYKTHKIAKGDTLTKISKRYDVNKTTLLKVNNLRSGKLKAGRNLRIPYSTISYQLLPEGSTDAMLAYKDSLILHRIKKGETISKISNKYHVPAEMIVAWNGLKNSHSIRAGQQLALYIDHGKPRTSPQQKAEQKVASNTSNIIILRPYKKNRHTSSEPVYQYYSVQNGDSLWSISRKFRTSTIDIKKWNNLKSNLIHPGSKLKLKKG